MEKTTHTTGHDGPAYDLHNPQGRGRVVLICEHASSFIPSEYNNLGLRQDDLESHAAWDPGALDISKHLSDALDAPLLASRVSRLVYDCNRPPEAASAMPEKSERIVISGNHNLSQADRDARTKAVYDPFCDAFSTLLAQRTNAQLDTIIVTIHSFTPIYFGEPRAVEIGILHDTDKRIADGMLAAAKTALPDRVVLRNEPYGPADGVTHSLQKHGIAHGLANVMIEVRNDLCADDAGCAQMAAELLAILVPALDALPPLEDR